MEILCTPPISQILDHFTPPPIKNALTSKNNFNNETCSTNTFNHFNAMKNYNIAFLGIQAKKIKEKDESIYVIDAYGNFKKFNNPLEAAKAFNVNVASILKCAEGDSETVGDFVFAYADNVEETGRDGKKVPDKLIINLASEIVCSIAAGRTIPISIDDALEAKVKSKTKQISKSKKEPNSKTNERINASVYAIDKTGKYIKYEKVQDLLDSLDISKASVYKCLRKEKDNINGIVFCYDFEVETINEKGEIVPNNRLIKKQIRSLRKETSYATLDLLLLRKQQSANPDGKIPAKTISNCDPNSKLAKIEDLSDYQGAVEWNGAKKRVYSLSDLELFLKNLPLVAVLLSFILLSSALLICSCLLVRDVPGNRKRLLANLILIVLLTIGIPVVVNAIHLPASLLPRRNILEWSHYTQELRQILGALNRLPSSVPMVQTLLASARQTRFLVMGILSAGLFFTGATAAAELYAARRSRQGTVRSDNE